MLSCHACMLRFIRAIDSTAPRNPRLSRNVVAPRLPTPQRRFLQTPNVVRKVESRDDGHPPRGLESDEIPDTDRWQRSTQAAGMKAKERKALTRPLGAGKRDIETVVESSGDGKRRDPTISLADWNRRRRELQHLRDPLELANFVKQELGKGKETEMLQLVRIASRSMECVVSWNHIIKDALEKGKVNHALKVYNEMKKRAQFPDAYTYSILLRGMSDNAHNSGVLAKALSVYHSMFAENSRVQPSIIHTNSMLRVCARTKDMDALWGVAAKIPERGPGAANAVTYTAILNAIRFSLLVDVPLGESAEETADRRERGIMEGRRVWEEIVSKWRNGDLIIEEQLVCAMGRLLLVGARPRDWDDVLSLVEQTMDIPRVVPRLGSVERTAAGFPPLRAPGVPDKYRSEDEDLSPSKPPARGDEFLPLAPHGVGNMLSDKLTYAKPSNDTLSLVMEACQKTVTKNAADKYWDLLTDPGTYAIEPDLNNLNQRLRVLRQNRASNQVVELLQKYFLEKNKIPGAGTLRIAMSTCVRDKNNHHALKAASQILDIMMKTREDADAKSVARYAELAREFPLATGADLADALTRLSPVVDNLRLQLTVGGKFSSYLRGAEREDAIIALRKIIGLFHKLTESDMIEEKAKKPFKKGRARLSAFLSRVTYKDGESSQKWAAVEASGEKSGEGESSSSLFQQKGKGRPHAGKSSTPGENKRPWSSPVPAESA